MNNSNIKIYLGISFVLIIIFILILVIPFTKQPVTNNQQPIINFPTPTSVVINPSPPTTIKSTPITVPANFTGVLKEQLPQQIIDLSAQKKDLKSKVPLSLTTFTVDFDYNTDKFVVTLKDPKDQAQKEFESWRAANYPGLGAEQFIIK